MVIRLSKFVGRDQLPGDEVAFNRINALFDRARKVQPVSDGTEIGDLEGASKLRSHTKQQITEKVYRRIGEAVKPTK